MTHSPVMSSSSLNGMDTLRMFNAHKTCYHLRGKRIKKKQICHASRCAWHYRNGLTVRLLVLLGKTCFTPPSEIIAQTTSNKYTWLFSQNFIAVALDAHENDMKNSLSNPHHTQRHPYSISAPRTPHSLIKVFFRMTSTYLAVLVSDLIPFIYLPPIIFSIFLEGCCHENAETLNARSLHNDIHLTRHPNSLYYYSLSCTWIIPISNPNFISLLVTILTLSIRTITLVNYYCFFFS
jgi:hypothetical protein